MTLVYKLNTSNFEEDLKYGLLWEGENILFDTINGSVFSIDKSKPGITIGVKTHLVHLPISIYYIYNSRIDQLTLL